jgi:pimeloyl-ACP methyl ester carboxylesterase
MNTALHHPERVSALCLVAPAGLTTLNTSLITQFFFSVMPHTQKTRFNTASLLARLCGGADHELGKMILLTTEHHKPKPVPPVPIFSDGELAQITAPTHIIVGTHDEMFSAKSTHRRATRIAGLNGVHVLRGAGHGVNATHPRDVNSMIVHALLG